MQNMQRPATEKQKVLIQNISRERGLKLEQNIEKLNIDEAKTLIDSLIKAKKDLKIIYRNPSENEVVKMKEHKEIIMEALAANIQWLENVCGGPSKEDAKIVKKLNAAYDYFEKL